MINIGIIGIGWYAFTSHVKAINSHNNAVISAICRRNKKALIDAGMALNVNNLYTDWENLVYEHRPDAIIISSPHDLHAVQAILCLNAGIHVLVDKPMAISLISGKKMISAAKKSGSLLMVAMNRRFMPSWRRIKRDIDNGIIGKVHQINLTYCDNLSWLWGNTQFPVSLQKEIISSGVPESFFPNWDLNGYWRRDYNKMGGGGLADTGSNMIDLVLWLAGSTAKQVVALSGDIKHNQGELNINIISQLKNNVLVSVTATSISTKSNRFLTIYGENGSINISWSSLETPYYEVNGKEIHLDKTLDRTNPVTNFIDTIEDRSRCLFDASDTLGSVEFIELAYASVLDNEIKYSTEE